MKERFHDENWANNTIADVKRLQTMHNNQIRKGALEGGITGAAIAGHSKRTVYFAWIAPAQSQRGLRYLRHGGVQTRRGLHRADTK